MNIPPGTPQYTNGHPPITAQGVSWTDDELAVALAGPVAALVFDHAGTADVAALLEGLPSTEFESEELTRTLRAKAAPKDWEVGEAIAECYLTHHRGAFFPWPDGRDIRKPKSSLPGADLIGFQGKGDDTRFAFGEVKTSKEQTYPPQVVRYGEHSLNRQLLDLRDQRALRDQAFLYLGHRAVRSDWQPVFQSAAINYLKSAGTCVALFGVLIRDVTPHPADLESSWQLLSEGRPGKTVIELWAVYLPSRSMASLGKEVMQAARGGDA